MQLEALKPCPFCGGEATTGESQECIYAGCRDIDCLGHRLAFDFVDEAHAIAAWNRRTPSPEPTEAEVEAAARALCRADDDIEWDDLPPDGNTPGPNRAAYMISELLSRVEQATGPDRELDRDLCITLAMDMAAPEGPSGWKAAPAYTASIDDALALVERALPGADWYRTSGDDRSVRGVEVWWRSSEAADWTVGEALDKGGTPLAILVALLRALIAAEAPSHA